MVCWNEWLFFNKTQMSGIFVQLLRDAQWLAHYIWFCVFVLILHLLCGFLYSQELAQSNAALCVWMSLLKCDKNVTVSFFLPLLHRVSFFFFVLLAQELVWLSSKVERKWRKDIQKVGGCCYTFQNRGKKRYTKSKTSISSPLHLLSVGLKYDLILPCSQSAGLKSQLFAQINGR